MILSGKIDKDKSEFLIESLNDKEKTKPLKKIYKVTKDNETILLTEDYEIARKLVFGE